VTGPQSGVASSGGRRRYHHGDLRRAMVEAAVELAREAGPPGVVLREVARRVGVSAAAAYRHFASREELLAEVAAAARDGLDAAMAEQLQVRAAAAPPVTPEQAAAAGLIALGHGYVAFALAEPGLFRGAFLGGQPTAGMQRWVPSASMVSSGPYARLLAALEAMELAGVLRADLDVHTAALDVWSTVHGLAELLLGPQRFLAADDRDRSVEQVLDFILRGVSTG